MDVQKLWDSYQINRDSSSRDMLIEAYLPLVKKIVGRMTLKLPPHWDKEDVISHGIIGLIEAVERYKPAKGVKFETYATIRIKGSILDALRESSMLPRGLSDDISKVAQAIETIEQQKGTEASLKEIASLLNKTPEEVEQVLAAFAHLSCISLYETLKLDIKQGDEISLIDTLRAPIQYEPENQIFWLETKSTLIEAISSLPQKEQLILALYYHEDLTLKEIAYLLKITESRVSQIKSKILIKLRNYLEKGK